MGSHEKLKFIASIFSYFTLIIALTKTLNL